MGVEHWSPYTATITNIIILQLLKKVSKLRANLAPGVDAWAISLRYLMGAVLASGASLLMTYRHLQKNVVSKMEPSTGEAPKKKGKGPRMSMKDSFQFLMNSPYIRDLALLVISYGVCINIVEVSWKAKLKVCIMISLVHKSTKLFLTSQNSKHFRRRMSTLHSWEHSAQLLVPLPYCKTSVSLNDSDFILISTIPTFSE